MARRPTDEQGIRKIGKTGSGSSFFITLPMKYMQKLKWKEGRKVEVALKGDHLVIKDILPEKEEKKR